MFKISAKMENEAVILNESENRSEEVKSKKRGRKPSGKRKGYFYEEEEEAFQNYIESDDMVYRNRLFHTKLYPAFTKMIESIIRRYNLFTPSEDFTDTFNDTMSFLITKVNNFDFSKGKKVYSYCGTICKNYLIYKRTQDMKRGSSNVSYEDFYNENNPDNRVSNDNRADVETLNQTVMKEMVASITDAVQNAGKYGLTENEVKVGYALNELLKYWDVLLKETKTRKYNKTSVLYFIKEYTMLSTKEVRDAMKKYKNIYFAIKEEHL